MSNEDTRNQHFLLIEQILESVFVCWKRPELQMFLYVKDLNLKKNLKWPDWNWIGYMNSVEDESDDDGGGGCGRVNETSSIFSWLHLQFFSSGPPLRLTIATISLASFGEVMKWVKAKKRTVFLVCISWCIFDINIMGNSNHLPTCFSQWGPCHVRSR